MSTYGDTRLRCVKEVPGIDFALWDGYLLDRYTAILDRLQWARLDEQSILTTVAPYATGTVALVQGANSIALTGGTFTTGMTGRGFRVPGRDEWYSFTYVGAASGLLDRLYEGPTNALSQYKIYQAIYALSATTKLVKSLTLPGWGPLTRTSPGELNASAPSRTTFAAPSSFAPYMDDSEDPPHLQIELYPVPDAVYSIMLASTAEARGISGTGTTLLPWMRPSCLFAGAVADAFLHAKDINSAMAWEVKYKERLADMVRTENASSGPLVMTLDDYYTRHRMRRFQR